MIEQTYILAFAPPGNIMFIRHQKNGNPSVAFGPYISVGQENEVFF